ncbi:hypothetical protein MMC13_005892 [Lambiella insularis]|nr:hypothetical protein [Lambiella insularis]
MFNVMTASAIGLIESGENNPVTAVAETRASASLPQSHDRSALPIPPTHASDSASMHLQTHVLPGPGTGALSSTPALGVAPVVTVNSKPFTISAASITAGVGYAVDGSTMLLGSIYNVNGVPVLVASGGGNLVVGTSTIPLNAVMTAPVTTATSPGLGDIVLSMFNGPSEQSTGTGATTSASANATGFINPFRCRAPAKSLGSWVWRLGFVILVTATYLGTV